MTSRVINVVIRFSDGGVYATSPQAPGLAYGRTTLAELRAELHDVLSFYFDEPGPYDVIEHHEFEWEIAGHEIVIRTTVDDNFVQRKQLAELLGRTLSHPEQGHSMLGQPTNSVGEVLYVCGVATDTLGWIAEQFDARDYGLTIAVSVADIYVFLYAIHRENEDLMALFKRHGYNAQTTLSEVMREHNLLQPISLQHAVVA